MSLAESKRWNITQRGTRHCVEVPQRTHARQYTYILGAYKHTLKLLVLSEAAFIAHITFSKIESRKERESKQTYEIILAVCASDLHFNFEPDDAILTKLDMSVTPLDTRT